MRKIGFLLLLALQPFAFPAPDPPHPTQLVRNEDSPLKISPEFAARLANLNSRDRIRVLVFLRVPKGDRDRQERLTPEERKDRIEAVKAAAEASLDRIRPIVERHGGQILDENPSLLGTIPVEITVAGVYEICKSDAVEAIVEDQGIGGFN
ncbi:DNA primase [Lyngbya sp. CCY1209]|uniref:DNA primase n=1 Tax=Lyngbya sp. CCY1209 TaxID=2886103 RepID=UPI002D2048D6|nr:DNA primase [Lyngbya sp. CCY1209]MEB3887186.1 DNA primase [Lyngbya sp. CCY1209]